MITPPLSIWARPFFKTQVPCSLVSSFGCLVPKTLLLQESNTSPCSHPSFYPLHRALARPHRGSRRGDPRPVAACRTHFRPVLFVEASAQSSRQCNGGKVSDDQHVPLRGYRRQAPHLAFFKE